METEVTLLLVGGLIGLLSSIITMFAAYFLEEKRIKRQWEREDKLRREERERDRQEKLRAELLSKELPYIPEPAWDMAEAEEEEIEEVEEEESAEV